jgi:hypothetical protein
MRCEEGAVARSFARSPSGIEAMDGPVEVVLRGGPVRDMRRRIRLGQQTLPEVIEMATPTENGIVVLVFARRDQPGKAAEYELTKHSMQELTVAGTTTA